MRYDINPSALFWHYCDVMHFNGKQPPFRQRRYRRNGCMSPRWFDPRVWY